MTETAIPLRRIAACLDDDEASLRALDEGARLRRLTGAELIVVSAVPQPTAAGAAQLAERARAAEGARALEIPASAHAGTAVCEWAAREGVDLLIAAPYRGTVARMLLGSFAAHLLDEAPSPVLLARPLESEGWADPHRRDPWTAPVRPLVEPAEPLRAGDPLERAIERVEDAGCSLPVVGDAGELVGMLGRPELLAALVHRAAYGTGPSGLPALDLPARRGRAQRAMKRPASDHMRDPEPVRDTDALARVAELIAARQTDALPVVGQWDRLLGLVRAQALIRELGPGGPPEAAAEGAPGAPGAPSSAGYRHIVCCADDSPTALAALRAAAALHGLGDGALTVVHATQEAGGPALAAAQRIVADAAREIGAEEALVFGDPPVAAAEWAREQGVDLMIVAPHRGGIERALLGSFTRRLSRRAPCPLLVMRGLRAEVGRP
jgi:nucleotide-binding universal stress UspA family protein